LPPISGSPEQSGDGILPLQNIISAVRATGWDGVLSVEVFREAYWQHDPQAVANKAKMKTLAAWESALQAAQ
jgi:sugar phosphate isomerase/epimerase